MDSVLLLDEAILWVHLFCAVLFVGGSFFMWLVVLPASHLFGKDESERTQLVGKIAKQFGRITNPVLGILVLTGIYNASWYLPNMNALFNSTGGQILLAKMTLVIALIVMVYANNLYFGRRTVRLAREKKIDELTALRKKSRLASFANLALMIVILVLAVLLQIPP